jgi:hypothetical protein
MIRAVVACVVGVAMGVIATRALARSSLPSATNRDSLAAAPGIAALHRADSVATIHGVAAELRDLWDSEAVRIPAGGRPTITRAAIYAEDSAYRANYPNRNIVRYVARYPALSVHGGSAVEWGGFEGTYETKSSTKVDSVSVRGDAIRVMKRQADGSWRFSVLILQSVRRGS